MSVEWIEYKGKPILYYDCRGLQGQVLMDNMENLFKIIKETSQDMLILINEEGAILSREYHERAKTLTQNARAESEVKGHYRVKRVAVVGVDSFKALLLHGYNAVTGQNIKPFETEEEAKKWLIEE